MKLSQKNTQLFLIIGFLILANFLADSFFRRIDLTAEKRYSLSAVTEQTADSLDSPMYIQVFLEGDFPPNIRRFQDALKTTLAEVKQYSNGNIQYEFIDPSNNAELIQDFVKKGFPPIPVMVRTSASETQQKKMFPLAVMRYKDKEQYVDLLKGCAFPNGQIDFLKAEAELEYKLVSPMRNLARKKKGVVAIMQGHGEPKLQEMKELLNSIENCYQIAVCDMTIPQLYEKGISPEVSVLILPQPKTAFREREKYEIDQYLMRGGSLFFIMNQQIVDLDMFEKRSALTMLRELNLDDMFMKYGFKINYDLVQDLSCEKTEVFQEGASGGTFTSVNWIFSPMAIKFPDHPVARNVDQVLMRYASSIDTLHRNGVKQSVFLASSEASRTVDGAQFIDVAQYASQQPPKALFRKGNRIVGLMSEGEYESNFVGREIPRDSLAPNPPSATFGAKSGRPGKIAVIADGEFIAGKNFRGKRGYIPYDNKTMILNAVDYLAGDLALTQIRSKEVDTRMLDKEKVVENATWIRLVNLLLPVLLIVVFGLVRYTLRKRKNEALKQH